MLPLMASKRVLLLAVVAAAAAVLPPLAMAVEIVVGDESGWQPDVDYSTWAEAMEFRVGDKLSFNYAAGEQNVVEVVEAGYRACAAVGGNKTLETGHDEVPLETSGRKWFICSKEDHCRRGQKLQLDVIPSVVTLRASLGPPPPPPPSAFHVVVAVAAAAAMTTTTSI